MPTIANAANALARIVLDDGRSIQNPKPIPYLSAADSSGTRRVGDTLNSVQGVLSWGADAFRVHPTVAPVFTAFASIALMVVVLLWRPQGLYPVANR